MSGVKNLTKEDKQFLVNVKYFWLARGNLEDFIVDREEEERLRVLAPDIWFIWIQYKADKQALTDMISNLSVEDGTGG